MRIETDRITILPIPRETMLELLKDEIPGLISGYRREEGWPGPELLEALPTFINDLMDDPTTLGWHAWMIMERRSSSIIGDVGFKGPPDINGTMEMGFSIVPSRRRMGYAAEAVSSLAENILSRYPGHHITAVCSRENTGSRRTLRACGFRRYGTIGCDLLFRKDGEDK